MCCVGCLQQPDARKRRCRKGGALKYWSGQAAAFGTPCRVLEQIKVSTPAIFWVDWLIGASAGVGRLLLWEASVVVDCCFGGPNVCHVGIFYKVFVHMIFGGRLFFLFLCWLFRSTPMKSGAGVYLACCIQVHERRGLNRRSALSSRQTIARTMVRRRVNHSPTDCCCRSTRV